MWVLKTPQWGLGVPVALAGVSHLYVRKVTAGKGTAQRTLGIVLKYISVCLIWPELQMSNFSPLDLLSHCEDKYYKVGVFHL